MIFNSIDELITFLQNKNFQVIKCNSIKLDYYNTFILFDANLKSDKQFKEPEASDIYIDINTVLNSRKNTTTVNITYNQSTQLRGMNLLMFK